MRRLVLATLATFFTLVPTSACGNKKKPPTDSLPIEELSADDVLREHKRIAEGEVVGQLLMAPKIELDIRGVTVNGRIVATPSDLDTTRLARVQKIFDWLKGMREHWKRIHPDDPFHGLIELDAAPESDALAGESLMETAAAAGYPRVRLKIDEIAWDAMLTVPRSPRLGDDAPMHPDVRLRLRRALVGWEIDALAMGSCDPRPSVKTRVVKSEALAGLVDELCPGAERCLLSVEASPGALSTVAKLVAPAFAAGRPTNVSLDMFPGEGVAGPLDGGFIGGSFATAWGNDAPRIPTDSGEAPVPSSSSAAPRKKPASVLIGALFVNGRLAPDAVDKVVRAKLDGVRACYEGGLRLNPNLQGRATVKVAIDAGGAVAQACNGGSDLPSSAVIECIVQATSKLSFPAPESGAVYVVVPFMLSPP